MANFIQNIQGIRVRPSSALQRSGLFRGPVIWPKGYAFGGWVYNSTLRLGFSKQPTELVLSIVLEASAKHKGGQHNLAPGQFDISKNLLRNSLTAHDARNYAAESTRGHFYYIDMHGVTLKRMYLHDYSISIEASLLPVVNSYQTVGCKKSSQLAPVKSGPGTAPVLQSVMHVVELVTSD